MTSTHGAWRHAEVQFLLSGVHTFSMWRGARDVFVLVVCFVAACVSLPSRPFGAVCLSRAGLVASAFAARLCALVRPVACLRACACPPLRLGSVGACFSFLVWFCCFLVSCAISLVWRVSVCARLPSAWRLLVCAFAGCQLLGVSEERRSVERRMVGMGFLPRGECALILNSHATLANLRSCQILSAL